MAEQFDIICIGAGSGGLAVGLAAVELGLSVLLVEKNPNNFGGECLHTGCIPSKALLHASRLYDDPKKALEYVTGVQADLYSHEDQEAIAQTGIVVEIGTASFVDNKTVRVGEKQFSAKRIVVATGSRPRTIEIENHGRVPILTNETIFSIKSLQHIAIIGGGPIGCEMAQAFSNLGAAVTLIERGNKLLPRDEEFAGKLIAQKLVENKVDIQFCQEVTQIDYGNRLHLQETGLPDSTKQLAKPISHILLAIGRDYDFSSLNLSAAGIKIDESGKPVIYGGLYTSNSRVVFAGDAALGPQFSHLAEEQARVLLANWFTPLVKKRLRLATLPWVTFTDYEVAKFGLDHDMLVKSKARFRVLEGDFAADDRAITDGYKDARYKLYIAKKRYGREYVAGGTVVAPGAGELVQELALCAEQNLSLGTIRNKFYAYPTKTRFWQRVLLEDLAKRSLSVKTKKLLRLWYRTLH